jgi:hypothetical protein
MWMSFAMDGNTQEGKWLVIKCKTLKWAKTNNAPCKDLDKSPWQWDDCDITFTITMIVKQRRVECMECTNKGDELYDVPTYIMKF